ncbi:MAG: VacJ family lipoprotein [Gammaproteobacteria bacterium]
MNRNTTRLFAVLLTAFALFATGCAATQPKVGHTPAKRNVDEYPPNMRTSAILDIYDPWEGWNRNMYNFNAKFDKYVFMPAAESYKRYTPKLFQMGVHNFMRNIREILNIGNGLLQFRFKTAARSTGRLVVNSTLGVGGLADPASKMGMYYQREDFGQTLGVWGAGPGPYMVLPILGPSSLRDTTGLVVDLVAWNEINFVGYPNWASDQPLIWPTLLYAVDMRASTAFRYYEMGTIYEYLWVRQLYTEVRKFQIER